MTVTRASNLHTRLWMSKDGITVDPKSERAQTLSRAPGSTHPSYASTNSGDEPWTENRRT